MKKFFIGLLFFLVLILGFPQDSFAQQNFCQTNADCAVNEECYQPPMPLCPPGLFCTQAMPAKYCRPAPTPMPTSSSMPVSTPVPTPLPTPISLPTPAPSPPAGCYYQETECTQTPSCNLILVCPDSSSIIIGDTLPDKLDYQTLIVDADPKIFNLNNTKPQVVAQGKSLPRNQGYALGFKFFVKQGQNIDTLAKELDIETVGSYVGNHLYGPNKQRISYSLGSTRSHITSAPSDGFYYLIVQTFGNKEGRIQVQIYDKDKEKIQSSLIMSPPLVNHLTNISLIAFDINFPTVGRYYFELKIRFPSAVTLSENNTVEFFDKSAGRILDREIWVLKNTQANNFNQNSLQKATPIKLKKLDDNTILVKPQNPNSFDKGYYYTLILGKVFENGFGTTKYYSSFHAISTSGKTADLNNDNEVDIRDYSILSAQFGQSKPQYDADIDLNGKVDIRDYSILSTQFGS